MIIVGVFFLAKSLPAEDGKEEEVQVAPNALQRQSSLLTTYWSGSTDVFDGPASRHGSLNSLFQVALYLPS